jgi:spore maturation protein CgeB
MKILQISNFDYKKNLHHFYNCDYKIYFGLIKNGHNVYQFSNRDIARQSGFFKSRFGSQKAQNQQLIKTVRELKPELIVIGHAEQIENETLAQIRSENKNIKIAGFYVDALWLPKNVEFLKHRAPALDALFITTAGESLKQFKHDCNHVSFIPNPVDDSIDRYKNFAAKTHEKDVFFAGGGKYRTETCDYLKTNISKAKFNILGQYNVPLVYGQKYFDELQKCWIGLNLPQFTDDYHQPHLYSSDRIAQYFGNGLLTFVHAKTGYQDIFREGVDALYYSEKEELLDKLKHALKNKSKSLKIAESGWKKYHKIFNSQIITDYMVDKTFGGKKELEL